MLDRIREIPLHGSWSAWLRSRQAIGLAEGGMTMVCVTHETRFACAVADRVLFMHAGEIVETAPPEAFFQRPTQARTRDFLAQIL